MKEKLLKINAISHFNIHEKKNDGPQNKNKGSLLYNGAVA